MEIMLYLPRNVKFDILFMQRKRKTEKEKEGNIWSRKIFACGGEEKGGKYFDNNIVLRRRRKTDEEI